MKTPTDEGSESEAGDRDRASGQNQELPSGDVAGPLRRIADFRKESLADDDSFAANFGWMMSQQMEFAYHSGSLLLQLVAENPAALYEQPEAERLRNTNSHSVRLTERLANIRIRHTELKKKAVNEAA